MERRRRVERPDVDPRDGVADEPVVVVVGRRGVGVGVGGCGDGDRGGHDEADRGVEREGGDGEERGEGEEHEQRPEAAAQPQPAAARRGRRMSASSAFGLRGAAARATREKKVARVLEFSVGLRGEETEERGETLVGC